MPKYDAFYNSKKINLEASNLANAKDAAVATFKVRKSQRHMVSVVLVERDDGTKVDLHHSNVDF